MQSCMSAAWPSALFRRDANMAGRRSVLLIHIGTILEMLHGDDENHMLSVVALEQIIDIRIIRRQRVFEKKLHSQGVKVELIVAW